MSLIVICSKAKEQNEQECRGVMKSWYSPEEEWAEEPNNLQWTVKLIWMAHYRISIV